MFVYQIPKDFEGPFYIIFNVNSDSSIRYSELQSIKLLDIHKRYTYVAESYLENDIEKPLLIVDAKTNKDLRINDSGDLSRLFKLKLDTLSVNGKNFPMVSAFVTKEYLSYDSVYQINYSDSQKMIDIAAIKQSIFKLNKQYP